MVIIKLIALYFIQQHWPRITSINENQLMIPFPIHQIPTKKLTSTLQWTTKNRKQKKGKKCPPFPDHISDSAIAQRCFGVNAIELMNNSQNGEKL